MVAAVTGDLARIDSLQPVVIQDQRLDRQASPPLPDHCRVVTVDSQQREQQVFEHLVAQADWTLLIAPEWDGILLRRAQRSIALGGQLLGPGPKLIELAADKVALAHFLQQQGLPVPPGCRLQRKQPLPGSFPYPAVLKPRFGAGSAGMKWIHGPADAVEWDSRFADYRLEQYCPGMAVSVGILMGPAGFVVLPACQQSLSGDRSFRYLGGSVPIVKPLARRAERLAERVVEVLPAGLGYLGIDLVLGAEEREDRIIEVNPRLTTSYVGLSQLAKDNLAEVMLRVAQGKTSALRFSAKTVCFTATASISAVAQSFSSCSTG